PSLAIGQTTRELAYMTRRAVKMVDDAYKCLKENNLKWEDDILRREEIVDDLQDQITEYLAKLTSQMLTEKESEAIPIIMHAVHDVERIGDLAINILELSQRRISKKLIITENTFKLIDEIFDEINDQCTLVFEGLHSANPDSSKLSIAKEEKVNALHKRISSRILKDYNPKSESVRSTVLILDVIANLERIGDHLVNIAERIPAIVLYEPE
ncbi:Na/Pi cotransporter family protein, partial [bacterium]|nr:Na/Pi cotransporter family protein [bacterium]